MYNLRGFTKGLTEDGTGGDWPGGPPGSGDPGECLPRGHIAYRQRQRQRGSPDRSQDGRTHQLGGQGRSRQPEVQKQYAELGIDARPLSPEQVASFVATEANRFAAIV